MINYLQKFNLHHKVVFVCGGTGLLGREIVTALAQVKAKIVLLTPGEEKGRKLEKELKRKGLDVHFEFFDITDLENCQNALERIIKKYKAIHIWVNASYPRTSDWGQTSLEELRLGSLRQNVDMQLNSVIWTSQIVAKHMMKQKQGGSIINFSSIYGVLGNDFTIYEGTSIKGPMPYSAIKGGIVNLTRYLASYLGKYGIRANTVCPGGIFDNQDKRFVKNYNKKVPMRRMGEAQDIASVVLFLASDASSYMTGATVMVDGGWSII